MTVGSLAATILGRGMVLLPLEAERLVAEAGLAFRPLEHSLRTVEIAFVGSGGSFARAIG